MRPEPSEFKDLTPEQIKSYLALRKNMQAEYFMIVVMVLFSVTLLSALLAAFWKNEYAFASVMGIVDGTLGCIMWRIAKFYFPNGDYIPN